MVHPIIKKLNHDGDAVACKSSQHFGRVPLMMFFCTALLHHIFITFAQVVRMVWWHWDASDWRRWGIITYLRMDGRRKQWRVWKRHYWDWDPNTGQWTLKKWFWYEPHEQDPDDEGDAHMSE